MTYAVPARMAHVLVESEDQGAGPDLYLMRLPDGDPLRLDGTAALIWLAAAGGSPDVVTDVADAVGRPTNDIQVHVQDYLNLLMRDGLLEQTGP